MDADAAREAFQRRRVFPKLPRRRLVLDGFFQLGILVDCAGHVLLLAGVLVFFVLAGEFDVEFGRDHLRHPVGVAVAPAHHPRHIAHDRFCTERAEGRDLRHRTLTVFVADVFDHLAAPVLAKVHVDVGRRHALRIQEPLEQQLVFDRVDVGDTHHVRDDGTRRRSASRPHGNAPLFRPVNEIPGDEEIIHEPLRFEHRDLALQSLANRGGISSGTGFQPVFVSNHRLEACATAVSPAHALFADLPQIFVLPDALRRRVVRIFRLAEFEREIAFLRDGERVVTGFGMVAKQLAHFRR